MTGWWLMSVRNLLGIIICFLFLVTAFTLYPDKAVAQKSSHCDGYARDYAQRNSRGHVADGALTGVIGA